MPKDFIAGRTGLASAEQARKGQGATHCGQVPGCGGAGSAAGEFAAVLSVERAATPGPLPLPPIANQSVQLCQRWDWLFIHPLIVLIRDSNYPL